MIKKIFSILALLLLAVGGAVAQSTYTVKLSAGTEDSTSWSISPATAVNPGVTEGTTVTLTYNGSRKVKSIVATQVTIDLAALTGDVTAQDGQTLTGTFAGNYKISIAAGATVTLDGVSINTNGSYAGITCEGDATINLQGTNTVQASQSNPGIYVPSGSTLTIGDSGSLTATGGEGAAGIGSGNYGSCGNITINGGIVTATGGGGAAGIGSGHDGSCGNITITGGTVTATGGWDAACIGSGFLGSCGNITITGGTVTTMGEGYAAGIGSGNYGSCDNITINGGTVTAIGQVYGAGIGGAWHASCGDIYITGGTVTARGGYDSAGIGSGYDGSSCGNITIENTVTQVKATRGHSDAASIGAGNGGTCGTVIIGGTEGAITTGPYTYTYQP